MELRLLGGCPCEVGNIGECCEKCVPVGDWYVIGEVFGSGK